MDYALLNLVLTLALLALSFAFRKRILTGISRVIGPYLIRSVAAWAFVEEEQESEDGTKIQIKALSAPAKSLLAATTPVLMAEVLKNLKLKLPGGLPAGIDMDNIKQALPQLIMSMPGRNLNLGGFKVPKEIAAALSAFLPGIGGKGGGGGTKAKPTTELEEIPGPGR